MKFAFIREHRTRWSVTVMCRVLGVNWFTLPMARMRPHRRWIMAGVRRWMSWNDARTLTAISRSNSSSGNVCQGCFSCTEALSTRMSTPGGASA